MIVHLNHSAKPRPAVLEHLRALLDDADDLNDDAVMFALHPSHCRFCADLLAWAHAREADD